MIKRIGFFRELRHGDPGGPSLRDARDGLIDSDVDMLVNYLATAPTLAATGSTGDDALHPERRAVARLEIATDGQWVWPRDLAYNVRTYHVALPNDFIAAVRGRRGSPPFLSQPELLRIEEESFSS